MENAYFIPWDGVCTGDFAGLLRRLDAAYTSYLQDQVKSAESNYKAAKDTKN